MFNMIGEERRTNDLIQARLLCLRAERGPTQTLKPVLILDKCLSKDDFPNQAIVLSMGTFMVGETVQAVRFPHRYRR